jgi:proteasome component ECM29
VMKLVKGAGAAVRPQMPDLVFCMLESLSSLEDQRLNYAELHAERVGISTDKLENVRIAVAKDSPMWDTLDFCLRHVDAPTLELLVPKLVQLVRSGVGLNTRAGTARFISQLATRVGFELKPHSGVLLKVLFSAVKTEKSAAVKRAFANACGAVVKYAGEPQIQWLLTESVALYRSGADKDTQIASAFILEQISLQANEVLKGHYALVLPVAFIARFDEEKDISKRFEELWEENTSGGAALQVYMPEIVGFLKQGIASSSWSEKKKTAKATAYLAEKAGESVGGSAPVLLTDLLGELPGRLWEGKEAILESIGALALGCPKAILSASATTKAPGPEVIVTAVLTACSRKKASYRIAAFSCLEAVLKAFKGHDLLEKILPVLVEECKQPPPRKVISDDNSVNESDEQKESTPQVEQAMACLSAALKSAALSSTSAHGHTITEMFNSTLAQGHGWQSKLSSLSTMKIFLEKLRQLSTSANRTSSEVTNVNIKPVSEDLEQQRQFSIS